MQVDYSKIPEEMRIYRQWVVWRYELRAGSDKPTKVPYDAKTGQHASVMDARTWSTYDEALNGLAFSQGIYSGIGFVLTRQDPYTFIDLDDTEGDPVETARQLKIHTEFNSYSERSPSGTGLHIIIKAHTASGKRRRSVELYSADRFMTMTGDVYNNVPIEPRQVLAEILWAEMGGEIAGAVNLIDAAQITDDTTLISRALNAVNGDKFRLLLDGNWAQVYPSQSEADLAFINMLAFYTQNRAQIERLFLESVLGQRPKAKRVDYRNKLIDRAFDRTVPPLDFVDLRREVVVAPPALQPIDSVHPLLGTQERIVSSTDRPMAALNELWTTRPIAPPPGIMGEIAQYIYASSPRPAAETAIAGAIGLMAGICGRAYNISGTGLNHYIVLLARTGTGKEAIQRGVSRLMNYVYESVPAAESFIGPGAIASGQALTRRLASTPSMVSIIGEVGLLMQRMASTRPQPADIALKSVLLDVFNKSGKKDVLYESIFADKAKESNRVKSPAFSLVGESTPSSFYAALSENLIADGFLPRCLFLDCAARRPVLNEAHESAVPDPKFLGQLTSLCANSLSLQQKELVIDVAMTDDASEFLRELNKRVDDVLYATEEETLLQLWTRVHVKTLKLAALLAVGVDMNYPTISLEMAQWAYNVIHKDVSGLTARFVQGEVGLDNESGKQVDRVLAACDEYLNLTWPEVSRYSVPAKLHKTCLIPMSFLQKRLSTNKCFSKERSGAAVAIKNAVQVLIDTGDLREEGRGTLVTQYGYSGRAFKLTTSSKKDQ